MAHIPLQIGLPGIRGLLSFRPETTRPLSELAQVLVHDDHSLSRAERELIATFVSSENDCFSCQTNHGAIAAFHLGGNEQLVQEVKRNFDGAPITDKLKALLAIAGRLKRQKERVGERCRGRAAAGC